MTHKGIYTKFMIEYDKANITSSYPSLTEYEVATVLDKAYNALIAQKVTGNNVRRAPFEADVKAISDLQPLIARETKVVTAIEDTNVLRTDLPEEFLYFINGSLVWRNVTETDEVDEVEDADNPPHLETVVKPMAYDKIGMRKMPTKLVSHDMANKFIASSFNIPWIKIPVCYIEGDMIYTVYDSFKFPEIANGLEITYIKKPNVFAKNLSDFDNDDISFFDDNGLNLSEYEFECNDTVAEELISLAIAFALENVESQRLNSKLNMRGLEA